MGDNSVADAAAAAQMQNLTWRAINAPNTLTSDEQAYLQGMVVSPTSGIITQAQDAANEAAKHQAAFSQPRNDLLVARSPEYESIMSQYVAQHGGGPRPDAYYDTSTAAGIAALVSGTGGAVNPYVAATAINEGYSGPINLPVTQSGNLDLGRSTVPIRDYSSQILSGTQIQGTGPTVTTYVPYGSYTQEKLEGTKLGIDYTTGELAIYQQPTGHSLYSLVGGGGRGSLQSGMFTVGTPETPYTTSQTDVGSYSLPSGKNMSRLGSEAYGGYVQPLDSRTLGFSQLSSYANVANLANYVNPYGANLPKSEAPGAAIPTTISAASPAIQYMGSQGMIAGSEKAFEAITGGSQSLGSQKEIAPGVFTTGTLSYLGGTPSTSHKTTDQFSGVGPEVVYTGASESQLLNAPAPFISHVTSDTSIIPAYQGYSGGLLGQLAFGEKAPEVIKGAVGSVIDVIPSWFGFTPIANTMRVTDEGYSQFKIQRGLAEADLIKMQDYAKTTYGTDIEGKIIINPQNPEAVAFKEKYESAGKNYETLIQSGIEKGYLSYVNGGLVESKDQFVYDYGEFSKWGAGAGEQIRQTLGFTKPQLEAYGIGIESKTGIENIPEKIVYGAGYTLSTRPEKIVTAVGAGALLFLGGEAIGGVAEIPAIASRLGAASEAYPTLATASRLAIDYGIPATFIGATYYGASEGLTASPERTTINIGKMTPELAGMALGGALAYGGLRAIDSGYFGFKTIETKYAPGYQPREIDLTKLPETKPENIGTVESPLPLPKDLTPVQSLREPYLMVGKSRYGFEITGESKGLPSDIQDIMSGEKDIIPLSTASGFVYGGVPTYQEMRTIAEYTRVNRMPENVGLSPQTIVMREKQMADFERMLSQEPTTTRVIAGEGLPELKQYALPQTPEFIITSEMAERSGIQLQPANIGKSTEAGIKVSGAPISQQMLEQVINPEISRAVSKSQTSNIDVEIQKGIKRSEIKPIAEIAKMQTIVPSATAKTFEREISIKSDEFSERLNSILESEKRKEPVVSRVVFQEERKATPKSRISPESSEEMLRTALSQREFPYFDVSQRKIEDKTSNIGAVARLDLKVDRIAIPSDRSTIESINKQVSLGSISSEDITRDLNIPTVSGVQSKSEISTVTQTSSVALERSSMSSSAREMNIPKVYSIPEPSATGSSELKLPKIYAIPDTASTPSSELKIPKGYAIPGTMPKPTDIITPVPPIIIPPPKIPALGGTGGGGAGSGAGLLRHGRFIETFYIGPRSVSFSFPGTHKKKKLYNKTKRE